MTTIRILLLEDSDLDAALTLAKLDKASFKYSVERVDNRPRFLEAVTGQSYDIILADYALPSFDGLSALELARRYAPGTPFILVSGVLGEEFAIDALHRGATDYVLKPRLERLVPSVERAINEARNAVERQRSEEALRQSQEFSRRIVESSRDCVMTVSAEGDLLSVNAFGRELLGLGADLDVVGLRWIDFWNCRHRNEALAAFELARTDGSGAFEASSELSDGSIRYWDVLVSPVLDAGGRTEQLVSIARDITYRKRAEAERQALLASEREARAEAEERNVQLQRSLEDLEHFAFAVSHDLREPLRGIALYSQLLARRSGNSLDANALQYLENVETGVRKLDVLLSDLLRYSRVIHVTEDLAICDMNQVVQEAVANCSVSIAEARATVHFGALPEVSGNHAQLVQVVQNLIDNAIKYRSSDPPRVTIEAEPSDPGQSWRFRVTDNGIGFEDHYSERIFGIFKRLHGNAYPGTGVGLAICKRVIERHGGRMWAESRPGQGSRFFFTLQTAGGDTLSPPVPGKLQQSTTA
ncbi:MAG TPA: ATP-binding protein [Bryobacteraceae bacterium]|nr:ATP-binding protein [Bryobacteraceae bacterium]